MGKVSPKDKESIMFKANRKSRKARSMIGAPAQLRCSKVSPKSCKNIGKKRVLVLDSKKVKNDLLFQAEVVAVDHSTPTLSPKKPSLWPILGSVDGTEQKNLPETPKTPLPNDFNSGSRLESLPMDLLVKILCHLHHDQLKAVFHVSHRISEAATLARKCHFDYMTPDRTRQEMLRTKTPLPTEHWPFISKGDGKEVWASSPHTPKAPKHGPRPPSRLKGTEMRQVAAVLFQECAFPSRCIMARGLPRAPCKAVGGSNRVLFYEEELCQAVAQNRLH